jgi:hypothetical protein
MSYEKLFAQASSYISSDQVFRQLMMRATTRHGEKFRPSFSEVSAMIALGEHGPLSGFVRRRGKEAHDFARGLLILQRYRNELLHETQPVIDRALSWLPVWQECLTISLNWKLSGPREVAEESVKGHRRSVA